MFTIVIRKAEDGFIGRIKEVPLLGQLQSANWELLAKWFKEEIQFLVKDRPDLQSALIRVNFE
jgi:hypothetical protein